MDIQTRKLFLIEQLTRVEDDRILEQIEEILGATSSSTVGFDEKGNPISYAKRGRE